MKEQVLRGRPEETGVEEVRGLKRSLAYLKMQQEKDGQQLKDRNISRAARYSPRLAGASLTCSTSWSEGKRPTFLSPECEAEPRYGRVCEPTNSTAHE